MAVALAVLGLLAWLIKSIGIADYAIFIVLVAFFLLAAVNVVKGL